MRLSHQLTGNSDGPLVLFLHGFLGDRTEWDSMLPAFEESYRCVAIDLPGHGESRIPETESCGFVETATALIELVDDLDAATFSVVGYSMGGRIALYLSTIYAMRIDALVLESASPGLRSAEERAARRGRDEAIAQRLETENLHAFLADWYAQPLFTSIRQNPQALEALIHHRARQDGAQLAASLRALGTGSQPSLWTEWENNHIPTLLLTGELDEKYAGLAREMWEWCDAAKVGIVPDCGHNVHFENASVYTERVLAFLKQSQE